MSPRWSTPLSLLMLVASGCSDESAPSTSAATGAGTAGAAGAPASGGAGSSAGGVTGAAGKSMGMVGAGGAAEAGAGAAGAEQGAGAGGGGGEGPQGCAAPACQCDTCWATQLCMGVAHDAAVDACIDNPEGLEVVKLTTDEFTVEPGEETYQCQNFANPLGRDFDVVKSESFMTGGSHHMFAFEAPGAQDGPVTACSGLELDASLHTSQTPFTRFTYPEGVGVSLAATLGVRINAHYLNTTSSPIRARVTQVFYVAKPGTVQHRAAHLFLNNVAIFVPPRSRETMTKTCTMPKDVEIVAGASHMHKYGRRFVARAGDKVIYETDRWADPPFKTYSPPLALAKGDTITFECEYDNTSDSTLTFGESAESNEMCIFSARYFPADNGEPIECM